MCYPVSEKLGWKQRSWVFQQDNDPKAHIQQHKRMIEKGTVINWPAMTPDLNPNENLGELKSAIAKKNSCRLKKA